MNTKRILWVVGGGLLGVLLGLLALRVVNLLNQPRAALAIGQPAPGFELQSLDGEAVRLSDFRDKVVLLNFWATWCAPCKKEMPLFEARYQQHGDALAVVAVNAGETQAKAQAFVDELGLTFPVLLADRGRTGANYNVSGYPTSFLIDRDGVLRAIFIGEMDAKELDAALQEMEIEP